MAMALTPRAILQRVGGSLPTVIPVAQDKTRPGQVSSSQREEAVPGGLQSSSHTAPVFPTIF